jgi:hypothetical protein
VTYFHNVCSCNIKINFTGIAKLVDFFLIRSAFCNLLSIIIGEIISYHNSQKLSRDLIMSLTIPAVQFMEPSTTVTCLSC